jgi:4-hydroxythreonine-4-phosphate dehydrogenase
VTPVVAVTMGDAGGIGPELIVGTLARSDGLRALVLGEPWVFERAAGIVAPGLAIREVAAAADALYERGTLDVLRPAGGAVAAAPFGRSDASCGRAAGAALRTAYELAAAGSVDGVVSAPLCKATFHAAGFDFLDELEYLADLTASPEPVLVGVAGELWTVAATLHVPLRAVPDLITRERVVAHARALDGALRRSGRPGPRLALLALNPHAGEGGLLGGEERDVLAPAVAEARAEGVDVDGPFPADTLFPRAFAGAFDGVVCLYHDQANIARKLRGVAGGATLFLGLPVICATTAHGTAFDLAGTGRADQGSFRRALELAVSLARQPVA